MPDTPKLDLLHELQESISKEDTHLGPIFLRLRIFAAKLGSAPFTEWVKHESEGYPDDAEVPNYRIIPPSYKGTFWGPFGARITNAPIPIIVIQKYGGESWLKFKVRQSVAEIDHLIQCVGEKGGDNFTFDASNLILALSGKIYEGYSCNAIHASLPSSAIINIANGVRTRLLDFLMQVEESVPAATTLRVDTPSLAQQAEIEKVEAAFHAIITLPKQS